MERRRFEQEICALDSGTIPFLRRWDACPDAFRITIRNSEARPYYLHALGDAALPTPVGRAGTPLSRFDESTDKFPVLAVQRQREAVQVINAIRQGR